MPTVVDMKKLYKTDPTPECRIVSLNQTNHTYDVSKFTFVYDFSNKDLEGEDGVRKVEFSLFPSHIQEQERLNEVAIVCLGIQSYSLQGLTCIGIKITSVPDTILYNQPGHRYNFIMMPDCSQTNIHHTLFKASGKRSFLKTEFPLWTKESAQVGVRFNNEENKLYYYLPIVKHHLTGDIICPIGYFKHRLLIESNMKPQPEQIIKVFDDKYNMSVEAFKMTKLEYDETVKEFQDMFYDTRLILDAKNTNVSLYPFQSKVSFYGVLILDLYYCKLL